MERINISDRVQITEVAEGEQNLLNKTGRVIVIVDDTNCIVLLEGGDTANILVSQLKKVEGPVSSRSIFK